MPKSSNQKLKLLYLRRILLEETDDTHHLNAEQLVSRLEQLGINADRKTIYADVAALQDYGMDIFLQRGPGGGYSVSSREFELPELKLLVDAIQCSRFITEKKSRELIGKIESLASREEARQLQRQVYVSDREDLLQYRRPAPRGVEWRENSISVFQLGARFYTPG